MIPTLIAPCTPTSSAVSGIYSRGNISLTNPLPGPHAHHPPDTLLLVPALGKTSKSTKVTRVSLQRVTVASTAGTGERDTHCTEDELLLLPFFLNSALKKEREK